MRTVGRGSHHRPAAGREGVQCRGVGKQPGVAREKDTACGVFVWTGATSEYGLERGGDEVGGNRVAVGVGGRPKPDADLRCIEWKTGKVKWGKVFPGFLRERSSLLYVDGHFIYQGELGVLRLIKATPEKYEVVSEVVLRDPDEKAQPRALLREPCWAAPILSHGLLYVRGDERLACLEVIPAR